MKDKFFDVNTSVKPEPYTIELTKKHLEELLTTGTTTLTPNINKPDFKLSAQLSLNEKDQLLKTFVEHICAIDQNSNLSLSDLDTDMEISLTRKELIQALKNFDVVDPEGKLPVVLRLNGTMFELEDVTLENYSDEDVIVLA
jgi:hypothetical protein